MSGFRKGGKDFGYHYMTDADRERIANIDHNPFMEHRKCKFRLTLTHPDVKDQQICIMVYGKDITEVRAGVEEHIMFFQKADKKWKASKLEDMKTKDAEEQSDAE